MPGSHMRLKDRLGKIHELDCSRFGVFGSALDPALWEKHHRDYEAGRRDHAPDLDLVAFAETFNEFYETGGNNVERTRFTCRMVSEYINEFFGDVKTDIWFVHPETASVAAFTPSDGCWKNERAALKKMAKKRKPLDEWLRELEEGP